MKNKNTMLGMFWNILNPLLQLLVYWFVFTVGLRSSAPKGNYPYIIWMICGIIPWFYFSEVLTTSCSSIYSFSSILKRIKFPLAVVPIKTLLSNFITHIFAMLIVIVIAIIYGVDFSVNSLYLLYFMFSSLVLLTGYALFISAITTIVRDVQKLMTSIIRLIFYISPILWVQDTLPDNIKIILSLNPFNYLINGYRDSILYSDTINILSYETLYFWIVSLIVLYLGCKVHVKFRKMFFDII